MQLAGGTLLHASHVGVTTRPARCSLSLVCASVRSHQKRKKELPDARNDATALREDEYLSQAWAAFLMKCDSAFFDRQIEIQLQYFCIPPCLYVYS